VAVLYLTLAPSSGGGAGRGVRGAIMVLFLFAIFV